MQEHRASAVLGRSTRALQRNLTCERISLQVEVPWRVLQQLLIAANNAKERVIKLVERQVDPFQPPKFKHKKATGGEGFAHLVALRVKGVFSLSLSTLFFSS